jgi:hypothetical protein
MTTRDDFTARVVREMIAGGRSVAGYRSAVDKPLPPPSMPLPPSPAPPSPIDPRATAAFIVAAGRRARGQDKPPDDNAPLRPGQLVLDAVRRQREGK